MKKIFPVIIAVVQKGDKFLITQRKEPDDSGHPYNGYWQLVGGGMEFGENPVETVLREVKEEAGIDVDIIRLLPEIYTETRGEWQGIFIAYLCKMKNEDKAIVISHEASAYKWVTLEELKQYSLMPFVQENIDQCA